ncbi:MAG: energy-coupling factor transporter transmembrane component T family protein [Phycisphaerae bacterium]
MSVLEAQQSSAADGAELPSVSPARLDVRIRLLIALAASVAVLALSHPAALGLLGLVGAAYMGALRRWRVQLICYGALLVLAGLSVGFFYILQAALPMMRASGPEQLLVPFLRMLAMVHAVMPLALSMRLRDVLSLMKGLRFPRALYLPLAVTIRFIPGFIHDLRQMRDCLRLRGYGGWSLLRPRLWLLPVVFRCLHLSDELAVAAELKGVGYGRPAHARGKGILRWPNLATLAVLLVILSGAIWLDHSLPATDAPGHPGDSHSSGRHAQPADRHGEGRPHAAP